MTHKTMQYKNVEKICNEIEARRIPGTRFILAIAGPPGAGKTTLAKAVVDRINHTSANESSAALLPMDGFHLDNRLLKNRNLLARKGAPETFDAEGFCAIVQRLSGSFDDVFHPTFDRSLDMAIANAGVITGETS